MFEYKFDLAWYAKVKMPIPLCLFILTMHAINAVVVFFFPIKDIFCIWFSG